MLRLHDTAAGTVVPFEPRTPGQVSMYVCGPTVYGPPHLGHGRFALVFDVLRRYLMWSGFEVTYVSNITDIDDKIIALAAQQGRSEHEVAFEFETVWWEVMDAIDVLRPDHSPHATDYVEAMVDLITELVEREAAYETSDGVYLSSSSVDDYGLLARQTVDHLLAGARVEGSEEKRNPIDFALWKKAKPGEPTWPSPWGEGRPGWHTECVVMSLDLLGEGFDLHGGGQDLAFPHHENERAQAVAAGRNFSRHWVHNGFVEVDGTKMSKSLGNFTNMAQLLATADARAYRLLVLRSHYRGPIEVTDTSVADASAALKRLDAFGRRASEALPDLPSSTSDPALMDAFQTAMDDDLSTPKVVDLLFTTATEVHRRLDSHDLDGARPLAAAVMEMSGAIGLFIRTTGDEVPEEIASLAAARDVARAEKDWPRADALRAEIELAGWSIEDSPGGATVRRG